MSSNRQWDSIELAALELPYNLVLRELSEEPRLVAGQNSYSTYGGKLVKRPATIQVDTVVNTSLTFRVDRVWSYETLDNPAKIYLVASAYNPAGAGTWGLYYLRLDAGGSPVWTTAGSLRSVDASTRPHEAVTSRGLLYVKGYPSVASGEKLGTVIFDGTAGSPSLKFWGVLGPSVPAHFSGSIPRINESATPGITSAATTFHVSAPNNVNKLYYSEDLTQAVGWTATTATVTANALTAPDGTLTATSLLGTGAGAKIVGAVTTTATTGVVQTCSIWLKSVVGTPSVTLKLEDYTTPSALAVTIVTLSSTWTRYSITGTTINATTRISLTVPNGFTIYAWGAQVENAAAVGTYNKAFGLFGLPAAPFNLQIDSELLTCTAFNTGTGVATVLRGAQGTVPVAHADKSLVIYRDWIASAHPGAVNVGWTYTYAYKTITGHISNRAPVETNPDWAPSDTGPFLSLIPKINIQGITDTTNVPTIVIYRSTDGGGSYMKLVEVTNLGAYPISYSDTSQTSTSGAQDPVPDSALNSSDLAAGLTTNSPPITVVAPLVVGTDTPTASTPLANYSGRLWLGIGNTLFFSANEEINTGIPEESWPTGNFGNFYKFQHPIVNIIGTTDALYVITTQITYQITGTNKETFNPRPVLEDIGGVQGHPRALCRYGDTIVWLTNDLRIAILQGQNFRTISESLGTDFISLINTKAAEIDLKYFADLEKEWITLTAICPTSTDTRTWVYDVAKSIKLKTDFWNSPWNIQATAVLSARIRETQPQRRLVFFTWTGSTGFLTRIATTAAENVGYDAVPAALLTSYPFQVRTNLFEVPPGDHINALRRPGLLPVMHQFVIERTTFPGDLDPIATYYIDDLWTTPLPTSLPNDPSRADIPKGFKTMIFPVNLKGRRVAVEINKNDTDLFEMQNLMLTWHSDAGANI